MSLAWINNNFRALTAAELHAPWRCALLIAVALTVAAAARADQPTRPSVAEIAERLLAAYPDDVASVTDGQIVFRDGARMPLDDGLGEKPDDAWLSSPDVEDMFRYAYPAGAAATAPTNDPGRARNAAFFEKIYGDCRRGEVADRLVTIAWLPGASKDTISVTTRNGAAEKFRSVARELSRLPHNFHADIAPSAGAYACRAIAGADTRSAHSYGIAVDIALRRAHYWRWDKQFSERAATYRNEIPMEIVEVFEKHGFIWGGRWRHYDTMHFEYRPELFPATGGRTAR